MNTKKIIPILLITTIAFGCKQDKLAELNKLRKQHGQLSEQIKALEDEVAKSDSSSKKFIGARVIVEELKATEFNHYIEVQGRVDGDENVSVSSQTGGIIDKIFVKEGAKVTKGQILAKLDDKVLQQSMVELKSAYEFANNMYEKQKALWDQKIGSEVQYLSAKNSKESLENKIATLNDQISMMSLKSPIDGTVEDIPIKIGQMVPPGIVAFRVVNLNKLKIVADIAEAYTSKIDDGDMVLVNLPDLNKEVIGKVDFSSKFINTINRTFFINIRLSGVDTRLKANMIAMLKINDYKVKNAIVVPINMIQTDKTGSYIVIAEKTMEGDVAKRVPVTTGITYKGLCEIKTGLKEGDKLISVGYLDLENGQSINY